MDAETKQNKPRTRECEDRSNRGSERPRNGAAKGCTKEQDEPRSGQSGQVPRTSAAEDQITRIGAGEGSDPRGSEQRGSDPRISIPGGPIWGAEPRGCEPRGSIRAAEPSGRVTT